MRRCRRPSAARSPRELMPAIRGMVSKDGRKVGHFDDSAAVLEFVGAERHARRWRRSGRAAPTISCAPRSARWWSTSTRRAATSTPTLAGLPAAVEAYREDYAAYYERCKHADSPAMRDPNAVVYLVPGVGMITFAKDKATARISGEFYVNAINVMRGADGDLRVPRACPSRRRSTSSTGCSRRPSCSGCRSRRASPAASRCVTGGAGGIGAATAERLLREGACVVLADIDAGALAEVGAGFAARHGKDVVRSGRDGRDRRGRGRARLCRDARSSSAGSTSWSRTPASPRRRRSRRRRWRSGTATWRSSSTGYFLVSREAFRMLRAQGIGGALVFVASKNGLAASPNASAYCTAKAAEIHLARCLALEGAEAGIRVNVVNPDAVLRGSRIWTGEWLEQRAGTYKTDKEGLEEMYRQRSLLKRSVLPEDIAEAIYFLASDASAKSTGNIINVDAGNVQAFTR